MIRAIFFGIVTGVFLLAAYLAYYTGYFRQVEVHQAEAGPFRLLYKDHLGPYHQIVPVIVEVETWAKEKGLACTESFGLYIDSPHTSEESRLRSKGGCLLSEHDTLPSALPEGFKTETLPSSTFVIAQFSGSPGISPFKVYPAALEYIETHRLQFPDWNVLEVYQVKGPRDVLTTYYFPVQRP